jgi:hypothetical protein
LNSPKKNRQFQTETTASSQPFRHRTQVLPTALSARTYRLLAPFFDRLSRLISTVNPAAFPRQTKLLFHRQSIRFSIRLSTSFPQLIHRVKNGICTGNPQPHTRPKHLADAVCAIAVLAPHELSAGHIIAIKSATK